MSYFSVSMPIDRGLSNSPLGRSSHHKQRNGPHRGVPQGVTVEHHKMEASKGTLFKKNYIRRKKHVKKTKRYLDLPEKIAKKKWTKMLGPLKNASP